MGRVTEPRTSFMAGHTCECGPWRTTVRDLSRNDFRITDRGHTSSQALCSRGVRLFLRDASKAKPGRASGASPLNEAAYPRVTCRWLPTCNAVSMCFKWSLISIFNGNMNTEKNPPAIAPRFAPRISIAMGIEPSEFVRDRCT